MVSTLLRLLIFALLLLAISGVEGGVDRQLRTYEDEAYSFENVFFRTGSTIYFQALGTPSASAPRLFVRIGGVSIEVGLTETPPKSGIYRANFITHPVTTSDEEDIIKTFDGAVLELRSDIDGDGVLGTSDLLNVTIDDAKPSRPRLCEVNATESGSVRVNWTEYKKGDFRRYTVVRAENQTFSDAIEIANITASKIVEWIDPEYNVISGIAYWYGVQVVDLAGNPSSIRPADSSVAAYNDTTPPSKVVGAKALQIEEGNSILLTWNRSQEPDVVGYMIYHAIDDFPMWIDPMPPSERRFNPLPEQTPPQPSDLIGFRTSTSFLHEGLSANYDHYYTIVAIDEEGNPSENSEIFGNTSDDTIPPGAPVGLSITAHVTESGETTGYLNVSWRAPQGEEVFLYNVYRSEESGAQEFWSVHASTQRRWRDRALYYLDRKVEPGKTYYYVVRAQDVAGNEEENLLEVSMKSVDVTPPKAVMSLRASETNIGGRIKLQWISVGTDVPSEYRVYRANVSGGQDFNRPIANVSRNSFTDRDVEDGVIYYYVVRAVDAAGNEQTKETDDREREIAAMSQDTTPPPAAKDVIAFPAKGAKIVVSWSHPWVDVEDPDLIAQMRADVDHYHVYWNTYYGFKPDPSRMITSTEAMASHLDVVDDRTYYYVVRSVDHKGNENLNDPWTSAVADTSPPGSPTDLRTYRLMDGRIKLDWDAPPGEVPYRYNIYRARSPGGQVYGVLPFHMIFDETEWVDDNVTHGQWYYYVIRSSDFLLNEDQNTKEVGNISKDTLPPAAPLGLVVTRLSGGDLMINWTQPEAEPVSPIGGPREADMAVSFRVYASTLPGEQNFSRFIVETPFDYYVDRGLRDKQVYYYVVRALDAAGNEDQNRGEVNGTADASPPLPPVDIIAQRTPRGEILLSWVDPDGEPVYEYRVYRFIGNQSQDFTEPLVVTRKNLYVDNDVAEAMQYRYVIRSVDKAGNEGRNTIETLAPVLLGPPQSVVATPARDGSIELTWEPPGEGAQAVREYNIYRSLVPGKEQLGTPHWNTLLTTYKDADRTIGGTMQFMVHGTRYYYTVRAVDLYGNEGIKSEEVSAVSDREPPTKPRRVEAIQLDTGDIQLRWQTPTGERVAAYRIYRSTKSGVFNFMVYLHETPRIVYTDTGLEHGKTYYYVVRSVDEAGNEEKNTEEVSETAFDRPPGAPVSLRATVRPEGTIVLTWNRPGGEAISYYNVYRSLEPDAFDFNEPFTGVEVTTWTDTFVENGRTYYYVVRAVDSTGNEEENENMVSALSQDSKAPLAPQDLSVSAAGTGTIVLSWVQPPGEVPARYRIYRSELPFFQPNLQYLLNETTSTSHTDRGLPDSKSYYYIVHSVDAIGNEDTNVERAKATTPPSPPMELEATGNDEGKIVLIWRLPETPVQKFRIYRSTASMEQDFSTPLTEVPYPNTLYVDSGLNHSETYHYVVRSVDSEGAEETNTMEISETSYELIPPTAPADVEATQMPSGVIRLGWSHALPEDVSVYRVYRGVGAGSPTAGVPIGETNLTHYEDMDTTSGQSYAYLVRAVDIHGNEETNRNVVRTMSVDILPPDPPSNLTASAVSGGDVELEWVAVPEWNVTYNVYRSSSSDSGNLTRIASTNATLFVDTGLVNGRKYFYAVRAQDAAGNEEGNSIMASAVASKGGPRVVLAIALVAIFVMGAYAVDRRRRIAEAEGA